MTTHHPKTLEAATILLTIIISFTSLMWTPQSLPLPLPLPIPRPHRYSSRQEFLVAHNAVRAAVGVGPMAWNRTLAAYARGYAIQRVEGGCDMVHSGGPYGENLAEAYDYVGGADTVRLWAAEKPRYDHRTNSCSGGECRHYTQLVWQQSVRLGCARAKCRNGWMFVICSYDPPGNYIGERPY